MALSAAAETALKQIARTMQTVDRKPGIFGFDDYLRLVVTHYENLLKQQEEWSAPVDEAALLKVAEKQLAELMRMGQAHLLMRKVDHVPRQGESNEP